MKNNNGRVAGGGETEMEKKDFEGAARVESPPIYPSFYLFIPFTPSPPRCLLKHLFLRTFALLQIISFGLFPEDSSLSKNGKFFVVFDRNSAIMARHGSLFKIHVVIRES